MSTNKSTPSSNSRIWSHSSRETTPAGSRIQTPRVIVQGVATNSTSTSASRESLFNKAFSQPKKTPISNFMKTRPAISLNSTPKSTRKVVTFEQKTPECFSKVSLDTSMSKHRVSARETSVDGEISNLTVAIRVRPMNSKELTKPAVGNIVQVYGNEVIVSTGNTADNSAGVTHSFQYDNAYWSCNSDHANYSNQETVFKGTALPLVDKAFEGYNACLFAYGQTGSGKSYSMMGLDDTDGIIPNSDAGIIPRFCHELFTRIEALKGKVHAEVEISYFEIYNEKIHDLLAVSINDTLVSTPAKKTPLRVREHPIWGPYIVDLSTHPVDSHAALKNWLAVGNSQRATAATGMNDKSSRSHSIFNIVLNLSEISADRNASTDLAQTKRSKISLVDLAGSERVHTSHTCASGDRLREGVSINKSLLTLGKVIAALADSKKSASFVPYRESVLTWLLRENLGGNSRTLMLATISPASIHIDETLATLRYACQARTIVNRVKVNEDPHDRTIRELRAEVERLQALRQEYERQKLYTSTGSGTQQPRKIIIETGNYESEVEALRQQLNETEQELSKAQRSWMDRLREAETVQKSELRLLKRKGLALELSVEHKQACLVNLAADPILSGTLLYLIPSGMVKIGRASSKSSRQQPEIVLEGPLVAHHHCSIENKDGKLYLLPENDEAFETFVNGELVKNKRKLLHGDRLVIGGSHFFRVANPSCPNRTNNVVVDYQTAYQEILNEQEKRLRHELYIEKQAALSEIEAERAENEKLYTEKLERLELEKFRYVCSKELLETEQNAIKSQTNSSKRSLPEFKPFQSTVLDDIENILKSSTKCSLHNNQMIVKEATQRSRDLGLPYEFKQVHVADENGKFRNAIKIYDNENFRTAEWPSTRLEIWLDRLRENEDISKQNPFGCLDVNWLNDDYNPNESCIFNESLNTSKIGLNLSAMKDAIFNVSKSRLTTTPVQLNINQTQSKYLVDPATKRVLFQEPTNENIPPTSPLASKLKSPRTFSNSASGYLKDIHAATVKLKRLCKNQMGDRLASNLLHNIEDIEFVVGEMKLALNPNATEKVPQKSPRN